MNNIGNQLVILNCIQAIEFELPSEMQLKSAFQKKSIQYWQSQMNTRNIRIELESGGVSMFISIVSQNLR